MSEGLEESDSH